MRWPNDPDVRESWEELEKYRARYDIKDDLADLDRLERSLARRRAKAHALRRRTSFYSKELEEAQSELKAVEKEIEGTFKAGAALIAEILDSVRAREGETWSPTPVLGFRAWRVIADISVYGARQPWERPTKTARCLNSKLETDVPHRWGQCGTPACGIYAAKDLTVLQRELDMKRLGPIVGLVAMSGKVIEHEHGYRAKHARAVALAGDLEGEWFATDDPVEIEELFTNPGPTLTRLAQSETIDIATYLMQRREVNSTWTWETRSGSSK